jgi:hypothetical protein
LFGIMPCRGVPQTTQASAFREISVPQQVQYAAKIKLQQQPSLDGLAGVKDSFSRLWNPGLSPPDGQNASNGRGFCARVRV